MTTESTKHSRPGLSPLVGALATGAAAVVVLGLAAALVEGRAAVVGVVGGGVLTLSVLAAGVAVVAAVARLMPSASLLVALTTYALQLVTLAFCVAAIERAGLADEDLSRGWFGAAVIAVTLLWVAGQLVFATRQRLPLYDLAPDVRTAVGSGDGDAAGRAGHPGDER